MSKVLTREVSRTETVIAATQTTDRAYGRIRVGDMAKTSTGRSFKVAGIQLVTTTVIEQTMPTSNGGYNGLSLKQVNEFADTYAEDCRVGVRTYKKVYLVLADGRRRDALRMVRADREWPAIYGAMNDPRMDASKTPQWQQKEHALFLQIATTHLDGANPITNVTNTSTEWKVAYTQ